MTLFSWLFGVAVRSRNRAYERGRLGVARLPAPVVSVGNLSTGGSGKTPAVIALARALAQRGWKADVLTRGYKRRVQAPAVAVNGTEPVDEVGDEPLCIARQAQVPVLVGADRFRSGLEGERQFASRIHLLDDGFQHRQLARAFDLVMVQPDDLQDRLLPAGRLRELAAALARASAIIWLDPSREIDLDAARSRISPFTSAPVWIARKCVSAGRTWPKRPLAFCGLARPESFWATLRSEGIEIAGARTFRDHHRYTASDLRSLRKEAARVGATGFITTAKDAVKLEAEGGLENLVVLDIELEIDGIDRLIDAILEACERAPRA